MLFYYKILESLRLFPTFVKSLHAMHNTFEGKFAIEIFGASHERHLGVRITGLPQDFEVAASDLEADLRRRRPGYEGTTSRVEADVPQIGRLSDGMLEISFANTDCRSTDYSTFTAQPRPGHADFVQRVRFGQVAPGGGIFSGRMTAALVAAGAVFKKLLGDMRFSSRIVSVGGLEDWSSALEKAIKDGDSLGGVVECRVEGVPAGIGEPFFDSVESVISHLAFSIPGVRGIEFGDGFAAAAMRGSEHNDPILDASGKTERNGAGGVNGGITNGNPLIFRVAFKPTSSIAAEQHSYNFETGKVEAFRCPGRHDACFALRTPVILEAIAAIALAELS